MITINTVPALVSALSSAIRGRIATFTYVKPAISASDLRVNATDGSGEKRDKSIPTPDKSVRVSLNFGQDYIKTMQRKVDESFEGGTPTYERQTIVPHLLYYIPSTNNYVLQWMDGRIEEEWLCDKATEDYFRKFKAKREARAVEIYSISLKYVTRLAFDGEEYEIDIPNISLKKAV